MTALHTQVLWYPQQKLTRQSWPIAIQSSPSLYTWPALHPLYVGSLTSLLTQLQTSLPGIMVDPQPVTARLAIGVLPMYMAQQLAQRVGVGVCS